MQSDSTIEGMLQQFVSSMVKAKGESGVNEDALVEGLSDAIDAAVLNALPTQSLEQMVALDRNGDLTPDRYDEILSNSGIDHNNVVMEAMTGFRDAYLRGEVA